MTRTRFLTAALVASAVLVVAGCGSSKKSSGSTSAAATPSTAAAATTPQPAGAVVALGSTKLGKVLVDAQGHTLYLFEKDAAGKSSCSTACAVVWPPLTTSGTPQAKPGVASGMLGTVKRADGKTQVTYNGHPLYRYDDDKNPGTTKGEGSKEFGAQWYVLAPSGNKIDKS